MDAYFAALAATGDTAKALSAAQKWLLRRELDTPATDEPLETLKQEFAEALWLEEADEALKFLDALSQPSETPSMNG